MRYFIDSADLSKVEYVLERFPCAGVTTNPAILARETDDPAKALREIRDLIGDTRTLFAQVTASDYDGMIREAEILKSNLGPAFSVKIPATAEGLRAMTKLAKEGYSVTATAIYSVQQVLLCAKAGADYVAPYVTHIDNLCVDSAEIVGNMAKLLAYHAPRTQVLAASFRVPEQVNRAILAGAGAVTIRPEMFDMLIESTGTDTEIEGFEKTWKEKFGKNGISDFFK